MNFPVKITAPDWTPPAKPGPYSRTIKWDSPAGRKALRGSKGSDACPLLPLATKIAASFYRKQRSGRFDFWELLSVAVERAVRHLGNRRGELDSNYARIAIVGALYDFARNDKVVKNVEMRKDKYARAWGSLAPQPAVIGRPRVIFEREDGGRYTVYPTGPYFTDAELRWGNGQVAMHGKLKAPSPNGDDTRHGKVSVYINSDAYNDEWVPTGDRVRPKFDRDDKRRQSSETTHAPQSRRLHAQPCSESGAQMIKHDRLWVVPVNWKRPPTRPDGRHPSLAVGT
jgi:hypothetical protein